MRQEGMVAIYSLYDPITNRIRYIGKAVDPVRRYSQHCKEKPRKSTHKSNWISGLLSKNQLPLLHVLQWVPEADWKWKEMWWIDYYRHIGEPLTNLTDGGEGTTGHKHTPETLAKLSLINKERMSSEERRVNMSERCKQAFSSPEVREHRRQQKLGTTASDESRHKMSKVQQKNAQERNSRNVNKVSPYHGVCPHKKKWRAQIHIHGVGKKFLGCYNTQEEAARAYDKAVRLYRGPDSPVNFPEEV